MAFTLNIKVEDLDDETLEYFAENGECLYCDSKEDSDTEKKRFLHIIKYCQKFYGTGTEVYDIDHSL